MEMHLVHYNTIYGSVSNATLHSDGLMVLGVFFEISEFDNPALEPLIQKAATLVNSSKLLHEYITTIFCVHFDTKV